jgi:hypothetical protein
VLEEHLGPIERDQRRGQQTKPGRAACPPDGQEDEQGAREPKQMLQRDHPGQMGREHGMQLAQEQRISDLPSWIDPEFFHRKPDIRHRIREAEERRPPGQ